MHVSRRLSRPGGVLASVAAATLLALVPVTAAQAHDRLVVGHPPIPPSSYLALGDSVVFGYTPPEVTPPAEYLHANNFVGYPELIGRTTHLNVANASCPGETSASLLNVTAQSNGCENSVGSPVGYRTYFPLHVRYASPAQSQQDFAINYLRSHRGTRLVTVGVGANDLFVCEEITPDQCTGADFVATLRTITRNVETLLQSLDTQGHYSGRTVVVSYYSLSYSDPVQVVQTKLLNAALATAARAEHARVADGYDAFALASLRYGGDPCAAGLLIPLPTGGCDVHPTRKGQQLLALAVAAAALH